jgi:glycosyltransferase involved in cell wall biosynthesis
MEPDDRKALGLAARRRIEESFTLQAIVARYQDLYSEIASKVA